MINAKINHTLTLQEYRLDGNLMYLMQRLRLLALAAAVFAFLFSTTLSAQELNHDPWAGVEEMTVTGDATANLLDLGRGDSVIAFDSTQLENIGAGDIADLAAFTPNLEIRSAGGGSQPTFFIRGVGLADFSANASGSIAIYQDDIPINAPAIQLGALFDVESVGVGRGPEGGSRHRNATAGVIKVYSRKPTDEFEAHLKLSVGNFEMIQVEGALNVPIVPNLLSARISFQTIDRKGWTQNGCANAPANSERSVQTFQTSGIICGENVRIGHLSDIPEGLADDLNDENNWAARMLVAFTPEFGEVATNWLFNAHVAKRDQFARVGQQIGFTGTIPDPSTGETSGSTDILLNRFGGRAGGVYRDPDVAKLEEGLAARFPLSGFSQPRRALKRNGVIFPILANRLAKHLDADPFRGDYNNAGNSRLENWGTSLRGVIPIRDHFEVTTTTGFERYQRRVDQDTDFSPLTLFELLQTDDAWQASQEIQIRWDIAETLTLNAGGLALREELDVQLDDFVLRQADPDEIDPRSVNRTREYRQKTWNVGLFTRMEWEIQETFTADAGVRFNWEKKNFVYSFIESNANRTTFASNTWDHLTYDLRLRWDPTVDVQFYFKFTHGWRSGHFNATANTLRGATVAKPEKIDSWEAGWNTNWFDGRLTLNGAAFYYRYKDYQVFVTNRDFGSIPEQVIRNADDAEIYGVEVEAIMEPVDGLRLAMNFGWLESQFLDFVDQRLVQQNLGFGIPPINTQLNEEFSGNRLQNSPKYSVSLSATYDFDMGRLGTIKPGYFSTWTDDVSFDKAEGRGLVNQFGQTFLPKNAIGQQAFWLHNLRLEWANQSESISVAGWVRNATNKVYKLFAFETGDYAGILVGDPRTYGADITLTW